MAAATIAAAMVLPAIVSAGPAGAASKSAAKSKSLTTVTLEVPNPGATFGPFFLGKEEGIYKKFGINLTIDDSISPPLAVQAILGGKLDFMAAIGTAGSAGIDGKPMRVYDTVADGVDFLMVGGRGIAKITQLKGKTIVGESAVSQTNLMEDAMLEHAGITPKTESFVNVTGGDAARAALVIAGKAQGVSVEITGALPLEKEGFKVLANTSFVEEPFTGLATSTTFADSHKALLKAMIKATTEATNIVRTTEKKTAKMLEAPPLTISPHTAKGVWKYMRSEWLKGPVPPKKAIDNQLATWKTKYELTSIPPETRAFTYSIAKQAVK